MSGSFMSLLIVESVLTTAVVLMLVYRSMLDMKEEDHIILDDAESHLARDQAAIRKKVTVLSKYLKFAGVAWSVLLVVILSMWVVQRLNLL